MRRWFLKIKLLVHFKHNFTNLTFSSNGTTLNNLMSSLQLKIPIEIRIEYLQIPPKQSRTHECYSICFPID